MRAAVVYYTRFGHTRTLAEQLAQELGAELRQIQAKREHGYPAMGFGAILNMHFRIEPMDLDFSSFDAVVLCTPIWAGRPACPTRTFLRDARLGGKRLVIALSTWGDEVEPAFQHIERELAGKGVTVAYTTHTVTKDVPEGPLRLAGREIARQIRSELREQGEPPRREPLPREQPAPPLH